MSGHQTPANPYLAQSLPTFSRSSAGHPHVTATIVHWTLPAQRGSHARPCICPERRPHISGGAGASPRGLRPTRCHQGRADLYARGQPQAGGPGPEGHVRGGHARLWGRGRDHGDARRHRDAELGHRRLQPVPRLRRGTSCQGHAASGTTLLRKGQAALRHEHRARGRLHRCRRHHERRL